MTNRGGLLRPDGKRTARERRRDRAWRRKLRNTVHKNRLAGITTKPHRVLTWSVHYISIDYAESPALHGDPKVAE